MPDSTKRIDELSAERSQLYLERNSVSYLECAVSLMLTHMSRERVSEILRAEARMVEELD